MPVGAVDRARESPPQLVRRNPPVACTKGEEQHARQADREQRHGAALPRGELPPERVHRRSAIVNGPAEIDSVPCHGVSPARSRGHSADGARRFPVTRQAEVFARRVAGTGDLRFIAQVQAFEHLVDHSGFADQSAEDPVAVGREFQDVALANGRHAPPQGMGAKAVHGLTGPGVRSATIIMVVGVEPDQFFRIESRALLRNHFGGIDLNAS